MAGDPNLYDEIERAIAEVRSGLPADGAAADDVTQWSEDDRLLIGRVQADYDSLEGHRGVVLGTLVVADEPTRCRSCNEQRPCSEARDLARRYGVMGEGSGSDSGTPDLLSAAEKDASRGATLCACGLVGQKKFARVSGAGVDPEVWVQSGFDCMPTRPGPHFPLR